VIKSFGDKPTEALFDDRFVREFQGIARAVKRTLEMLNAANRLARYDLKMAQRNLPPEEAKRITAERAA
jgi:plasmid maintenance system killer protein